MAMFVAGNARLEPLPFWKWLGMPALVVMSLPDWGCWKWSRALRVNNARRLQSIVSVERSQTPCIHIFGLCCYPVHKPENSKP